MKDERLPGYYSFRISDEASDCAGRLVADGRFKSLYQVCQVGLLQAASNQSILTPGTLDWLPPQDDRRRVVVRTYFSREDAPSVFDKLGPDAAGALDDWLRLVGCHGVPAPGTTAFMTRHKHHGRAPKTFNNLGASYRPVWGVGVDTNRQKEGDRVQEDSPR